MKRKGLVPVCAFKTQLPTDYFVQQTWNIQGLSDSVIRAEAEIYKWFYHYIEDSGKLDRCRRSRYRAGFENVVSVCKRRSSVCTEIIACIVITRLPSFLIVLCS